jgi:U4/U6 small nuclear ribonucleoprotein PRP31
MLSVAIFYF